MRCWASYCMASDCCRSGSLVHDCCHKAPSVLQGLAGPQEAGMACLQAGCCTAIVFLGFLDVQRNASSNWAPRQLRTCRLL